MRIVRRIRIRMALTLFSVAFSSSLIAQEDSINRQEMQDISTSFDSLMMEVQLLQKEVDSLEAAFAASDTLRMYMESPDVHYVLGSQKVVIFRPDGFEMTDSSAISKFIHFRSALYSRGFYLMQYIDEGSLVYSGQWTMDGYQSDVIEYNSDRKPIAIWIKAEDSFTRKELE